MKSNRSTLVISMVLIVVSCVAGVVFGLKINAGGLLAMTAVLGFYFLLWYFPALLVFWPFVKYATGKHQDDALRLSARLQAILFVATALAFQLMFPAAQNLAVLVGIRQDTFQGFNRMRIIFVSAHFTIMLPIAILMSCLLLKVSSRRQFLVLLMGQIAVGLITEFLNYLLFGQL